MKFSDVPLMGYFFEGEDLCQKVSADSAITPYCAKGFTAGFRLDEVVCEAVPIVTELPQLGEVA